jgi:hypothetical protein
MGNQWHIERNWNIISTNFVENGHDENIEGEAQKE